MIIKEYTMKEKKKSINVWISLITIFSLYCIIMRLVFGIQAYILVKFILANVFSILVPGFALLIFLDIKLSRLSSFLFAFLLGYAIIIAEYFISEISNRSISFSMINTIIILISIYYELIHDRIEESRIGFSETYNEIVGIFFLTIGLLINMFAYSANNLGTDVAPICRMLRDLQYWANNSVALKIAWPPDDLSMVGFQLKYHYFSNIPIAFISNVYSIDVFTLSFPLYSFTKTLLLIGAAQFLVETITSRFGVQVLGYILLIFSTGAESVNLTTFISHMFIETFGFDIGYAYGMIFVALVLRQWKSNSFSSKLFVGTILSWAICVGSKAPVSTVLILIPGFLCLNWLRQKKICFAFGYGIPILGIYLVICRYCIGLFEVLRGKSKWRMSGFYPLEHLKMLGDVEYWDLVGQYLVWLGRKSYLCSLIIRILCINPALVLGSLVVIVLLINKTRKGLIELNEIILYLSLSITAIFGMILGITFNAGGRSEIYFAMTACIPMAVIILLYMSYSNDSFVTNIFSNFSKLYKSAILLYSAIVFLGVLRFSWSGAYSMGTVRNSIKCIQNIHNIMKGSDQFSTKELINVGIRKTDVDAMAWIRDNTDPDSLIMSDKAVINNLKGYYMYGMFSERQQYLEGIDMFNGTGDDVKEEISRRSDIIERAYNNCEGALEDVKKENIDYIIQTRDVTPEFIYDKNKLELVKSTETVNIYRVK